MLFLKGALNEGAPESSHEKSEAEFSELISRGASSIAYPSHDLEEIRPRNPDNTSTR